MNIPDSMNTPVFSLLWNIPAFNIHGHIPAFSLRWHVPKPLRLLRAAFAVARQPLPPSGLLRYRWNAFAFFGLPLLLPVYSLIFKVNEFL